MSSIEHHIIDPDLFSGSSDTLRSALGGYWVKSESEYGTNIDFNETTLRTPSSEYFSRVFLTSDTRTSGITSDTIDSAIITPNKRFAIRIAGNQENIINDIHWRAIMLGGSFGEAAQQNTVRIAAYNELIHQDINFRYDMPYPKILALDMANKHTLSEVQISYDYSDYLPEYENYIKGLDSELLLPNYYILLDLARQDFDKETSSINLYPNELINFVSLEGKYEDINDLFIFNGANVPYEVPNWRINLFDDLVKRNTNLSIDYMPSSLPHNPLSAPAIAWAEDKLQTILFDQEVINNISGMDDFQDCMPFKTKIRFPTHAPGPFMDSINNNNFSSRFIKTLYETFSNKVDELIPVDRTYTVQSDYYENPTGDLINYIEKTANTSYREIDYIKFLAYCYDNYVTISDNCLFIGENNIHRLAAVSRNDIYRHINTKATAGVLGDTIDYISNESNIGITEWGDLFDQNERHVETIAYRIDKIGGLATGDNKTQETLQSFWFVNAHMDPENFEFFDSQVKFDTDYTYKVYAYILTVGIKYNTTDLKLTRQIGCEEPEGNAGLEFYDPFSGDDEAAERLLDDANLKDFDDSLGGEDFGSDALIYSSYPYLADLYLNYEPTVKIIEMPIYSKTLKVLDNPANRLNIVPHQVLDSSQRIRFDFVYDTFAETTFPNVISENDQIYKERYMHGQDLLEDTVVTKKSVSRPRFIEIYRLSEKPKAFSDFEGNIITVLDLEIKDSKYTHTATHYDHKIQTNRKYYYLFRALNQQRNLSHLSEIYETQLIDDGGYLYAIFNTLTESDLKEEIFDKTSKQFKKLFQLQPNLKQLQLNSENVDFNQSADSQISNLIIGTADDLIWDKTFKVRLTSKKTGRKIDLNITYYLNSE